MPVRTVWTQGLAEDVKTQFVEGLKANPYLKLLRKILEVRQEQRRRGSITPEYYEKPQWAIRRAHSDGADYELQQVLDLLDFEDRK